MKNIIKKYPTLDGYFEFPEFNKFQTQCLPRIMDKEDNLIVSAPTSSGKTVLFELAILKYFDLPTPMCLYLAPIKSLCHEKLKVWKQKFSKKLKITQVTGDNMEDNSENYIQSNILIGTPQKIDFLSRQSLQFLKKIKLLLIDEIHMLNVEERGATLEAIVSRIMSLNKKVRIIAVSASIPNIVQVGQWLKVPKGSICTFGQQYRPAKLNKVVMGYKIGKQHFTFEKILNFKLLETIRMYGNGKGCLIFCATQKGTKQACQAIVNQMKDRQFIQNDKQIVSLVSASNQLSNTNLQTIITQGVAFHNAGLSLQDRILIQKLFLQRKIKVLCTTSTLSMGINLPAHLVIIKSTLTYRGSAKGFSQYSRIQIDQMCGRAGRPPFDNQGTVVIMTDKSNVNRYNGKLELQDLQSQLFTQMLQHLNAQISLGSIQSLSDVQDYLKNSFCYIRMKKSPKTYNIQGNLDDYIKQSCKRAIISLSDLSIVSYSPANQRIYPKPLSNSISKSSVSIKTISSISKISSNPLTEKEYLTILCQSQQINRYTSKIQDRQYLKKLNQKIKYQYKAKQSISNAEKKCFVLIQTQLSKINIEHWQLRRQATDVMFCLKRLNYCVKTLAIQLKIFSMYYWAIKFVKFYNFGYWDYAQGRILTQFSGLQDRQKFFNVQGIKSISDLRKNLVTLENLFPRNPQKLELIEQQFDFYQNCIDLSLSNEKAQKVFYLKVKIKESIIDHKLKGINICIGDSSNKLFYYKYLDSSSVEINVSLTKNNGGSYKIGIIKEGIIGFDQFYQIQNYRLIRKNEVSQNEPKVKQRKSQNMKTAIKKQSLQKSNQRSLEKSFQKSFSKSNVNGRSSIQKRKSTQLNKSSIRKDRTQQKSKKVDKNQDNRQTYARNIMNKFKKKQTPEQNNNLYTNNNQQSMKKIEVKDVTDDQYQQKKQIQTKLPSTYRVKKPILKDFSQQNDLYNKKIKKQDQQFKFKPLNEYKWKPGFQQIKSSSEQQQVKFSRKLKLIQSKDKQSILNQYNVRPSFNTFNLSNKNNLNLANNKQKANKNAQKKQLTSSAIIQFQSGDNKYVRNIRTIQNQQKSQSSDFMLENRNINYLQNINIKKQAEKKPEVKQDIYSYFFNLFN